MTFELVNDGQMMAPGDDMKAQEILKLPLDIGYSCAK